MAYTEYSDFYVAVQDLALNRILKHVMRQRPSLFNYGTSVFAEDPKLLCWNNFDLSPEVGNNNNPIITVLDPLPVLMTSYGLNYCAQFVKGEIDFHPGTITLPQELNPPLGNQRLALYFKVCAGLGCPGAVFKEPTKKDGIPALDIVALQCFGFELFATGGCGITGPVGQQRIKPQVDSIEIVDLSPEGLENSIECYSLVALNKGVLPTYGEAVSKLAFGIISLPDDVGQIQMSAATNVPHNPAVEQDQLKLFINLDRIDLAIPTDGSASSSGGSTTRTTRSRTRVGTFDFTVALSEKALAKMFDAAIRSFVYSNSGRKSVRGLSIGWDIVFHLEGGSFGLNADGTFSIEGLNVVWEKCRLDIGFNLPEKCVGGFCIVPIPFDGCKVRAPRYCLFSDNPDFTIPLIDLNNFMTTIVSIKVEPSVFYGVGYGGPNKWQLVLVPRVVTFQVDIDKSVGDLVKSLIAQAIGDLLWFLPDWAQDEIANWLGAIEEIMRFKLGIDDDISFWLLDILDSIDFPLDARDMIFDFIATKMPAVRDIEDPYPVLPGTESLIPVKIPIEFLGLRIDSSELVIEGDIGD